MTGTVILNFFAPPVGYLFLCPAMRARCCRWSSRGRRCYLHRFCWCCSSFLCLRRIDHRFCCFNHWFCRCGSAWCNIHITLPALPDTNTYCCHKYHHCYPKQQFSNRSSTISFGFKGVLCIYISVVLLFRPNKPSSLEIVHSSIITCSRHSCYHWLLLWRTCLSLPALCHCLACDVSIIPELLRILIVCSKWRRFRHAPRHHILQRRKLAEILFYRFSLSLYLF